MVLKIEDILSVLEFSLNLNITQAKGYKGDWVTRCATW